MRSAKTLYFLGSLVVLIGITSCGKDKEEENRDNLIGSWTATVLISSECEDPEDNGDETLGCTDSNCIKYLFSVDSTGVQRFIKRVTANGVTISESGIFSVGETRIEFCQEEDEELICESYRLTVNPSALQVGLPDDGGCRQELVLIKDEEDEE